MKKLLFILSMSLFLTACGTEEAKKEQPTNESGQASDYPLTVTDASGKEVTIEEEPETIVSLIPSNTEIAYSLGLGDKIIGVSDYDNYPEEVTTKEKIGGLELNVELIVSLDPDLVLAHESSLNTSHSSLEQIEAAGIDVVVVDDAQSFDAVYDSIMFVGEVTNKTKEAQAVVDGMKGKLVSIQETVKPYNKDVSVYVEVSPPPSLYTVGKNTFMEEALSFIGATNIIEEEGWIPVDGEAVVIKNPDVIVTTYGYYTENAVEEIKKRSGWQDVTAVAKGQIYDVNSDLVSRAGPRLVEGVEELAKAIYPEAFTNK